MRQLGGKTRNATTVTCRDCRNSQHPSWNNIKRGCKCGDCADFKATSNKAYSERFREANGVLPSTRYRAESGSLDRIRWIDPQIRQSIYERDNWTCHLCNEPVDREADVNSHSAPSLDHLLPRSKGGSDEPTNLATAHRLCNAIRQDKDLEQVASTQTI